MSARRDAILFLAAALVPSAAMGALGWRALRNEEAARAREASLEVTGAAEEIAGTARARIEAAEGELDSLGHKPISSADEQLEVYGVAASVAPSFAEPVLFAADGRLLLPREESSAAPTSSEARACDEATAKLSTADRARAVSTLLAQCETARDTQGRWIWPVLAIGALSSGSASGDLAPRLARWFEFRGAELRYEEREVALSEVRELRAVGDAERARMLAALAPRTSGAAPIATIPSVTRAARSDVVQRALRGSTQEEGSLVTFRGPGVVGAVAALRGGGFAGFVVTPETLGRALASDPHVGLTKLPRALVASVATGDGGTPTDGAPEGVAFLQAGLGVRVRHRDPRAWRAEARRSERILVGLLGVGISLAVVLAIVLYRRTRAARRTSELRTSFVASVSHELRTPLASVRMLSELLAEERVEPAERKEVADALAREAVRMTETLDRLMVYAKSERGKLRAARAPLDLSELAGARVAAFVARHPEADVELRAEPETRCEADRAELELAIDNLLENALRHAPEGQPYAVSVRSTRERGNPIIYISVSDQGPGVPHGARRRIFEPFERGDARLSQAATGTGLGLFLVRAVARAHGGDATLEVPEPRGATFTLRFPAFATLERDES